MFVIVFLGLFYPSNVSHAFWFDLDWDFDNKLQDRIEEYEEQDNSREIYEDGEATKSPLRNSDSERFYYKLEAGLPDDDKAKFWNVLGKVNDSVTVALNETLMAVNNFMFSVNKTFTSLLVGILELSNNSFFVDQAVNKMSTHIKNMVGVSGNSFTNNGMFLPLLKIIAIFVVLYAFYKLVWKRSFVESFGELFKFIIVLTVSLLLFTNYSTFISGMNKLGTEVSSIIVGSSSSYSGHGDRLNSFSEGLWEHFVDEPYLILQYGTSDLDELAVEDLSGRERVRGLLTAGKDSPLRKAGVDIEINHLNNYYMSYDSVVEKTYLNFMFMLINGIVSIPIYLIALALVFTQFWFVIIAMIAPFALLIASFPSQFNVLRRYFFELSLPLLIRVALSFILLILMFLNTVVRDLTEVEFVALFTGTIGVAFLNGLFYVMLFIGIFLLRKRIMGILSSGSNMVGEIRQGLASVTTKPVKGAVQTATTVGGAAIGGAIGGVAGAMQGANMGATAGKIATGESGGMAQATQDLARGAYQGEMLKHFAEKKDRHTNNVKNDDKPKLTPEQKKHQEMQKVKLQERKQAGQKAFHEFMAKHGLSQKEQDKFRREMEKQKVDFAKVNRNTLERYYNPEEAKNKRDYYAQVASNIKADQVATQEKIEGIKAGRREKFNAFLEKQNLTNNEIKEIKSELDKKAIDTAYIPKSFYEKADADIRKRLEKGELVDYKSEFVKSISSQMKAQKLKEQKERIMNTPSSKESATSHKLKNYNHDQKQSKPNNTGSP